MEENKIPIIEELENTYKFVTYLIGAMEKPKEKDDGSSQRINVEKELLCRNVYPINPVKLEASKTGLTTEQLKEKMSGWLASGNWELFADRALEIWKGTNYIDEKNGLTHIPGDIDYCIMSDWITFTLNRGDVCCGSFAECGIAMEHGIPIYLITDMPKKELPKSLLQMILITEGEVFNSLNDYLIFVDKNYKLKRKEPKEIKIDKTEEEKKNI
jgi:hypothetical protein